jgi:hypothetical protein
VINIYFPLFPGAEGQSKEMRLVHEGLRLHEKVALVDDPDEAAYVLLLQNHLVPSNPDRGRFARLKSRFIRKTIMLDYDDFVANVWSRHSFDWFCYFKRSVVVKQQGQLSLAHFDGLFIEHISYAAMYNYLAPDIERPRNIDVACLFKAATIDHPFNKQGRGRILQFLRKKSFPGKTTLFDSVSDDGAPGRKKDCPVYFDVLRNTKILVTCNPSRWEGDSRLWEALASGCLVFVDRMLTPIVHPLIHHQHLFYYDLSDSGLEKMYREILFFLAEEDHRKRISKAGYDFVRQHHMSVHRIQQVVAKVESLAA